MIEKLYFVRLRYESHHVSTSEVGVSESETSLLLSLLQEKYALREIAECGCELLSLIAEINPEGSHAQRSDELSEEKKDLERIIGVEEEVVLFLERRVELGVENGEETTLLSVDEVRAEVISYEEKEFNGLIGVFYLSQNY